MPEAAQEEFADVLALVDDGRIDVAEQRCRDGLKSSADDVNLLALLGAILIKKGDRAEAEHCLRRAIDIEPGFAKPYEDLGALYLMRRDSEAAVPFFEQALTIKPDLVSARHGLAIALERSGRDDEADAIRDGLMAEAPLGHLLAEASALCKRGETDDAEKLCDAVLRRDPENVDALRVLAGIATDADRLVIAEGLLKRVVSLAPGEDRAKIELGQFLGDRGRYLEAIALLEPAAQARTSDPAVHLLLGNMLGIVGRHDDALAAYDACLERRADDAGALIGRGHMLRIAGHQDDARAAYERCTEVHPSIGATWWYLASLHRYAASDAAVETMQKELARDDLDPDSRIGFHFALARAAEKREDFANAWQHYDVGNREKRAQVSYDPVRQEVDNDKIRKTYTGGERQARGMDDAPVPIFVVGMPRSGSTLIEQILASHSTVKGTGELPYVLMLTKAVAAERPGTLHYTEVVAELDDDKLSAFGQTYLQQAATHYAGSPAAFADKMPANFPHVGLIHQVLPHAKVIDARRDPLATCVANYRQLFAQGKHQSYDLTELGEYYLQYLAMMEHWDKVLPGFVMRVSYEDVVADLEGEVRRLLEFCELPFEQRCIDFHRSERPVNTASSEQVREPIYRSAVEFWRHYEPYLGELREVLEPVLD